MNKQELIERLEKASNVKNWHYEDLSTELLDITYELRNVFEHLDEPIREECVPIHKLIDPRYSDYRLYCNFCDTEISSDDNYCGSCGRKINREKRDE